MHRCTVAIALMGCLGAATPAVASDDQQADQASNAQATTQPAGKPDFFFGRPRGSIGFRGSWMFARADSDLFDFVQRHLTVDKKDFNTPTFGFDAAMTLSSRIEIQFGIEGSSAGKSSEYRDYVDNLLLPIEQETSLKERNLSASIRYSLLPRGRGVSRYAWVPRKFTPYVGAGGGVLWYKFEQTGDFVDFQDLSVFPDYFSATGIAPSAHVFGGTDIKLYRALYLSVEGRYLWAKGKLGPDFVDFDPIDLAGFRLATGINILF